MSNVTASVPAIILYNDFENDTSKITAASLRGQWVNSSDSHAVAIQHHEQVLREQYSDDTWASKHLKSLATQLFVQQLLQANNKK